MASQEKNWLSGLPEGFSVGFLIEGMSPAPSGTWTRFQNMVEAVSSAGVAVHILGTEGVHDSAMGLPVESVELKPKRTYTRRFFNRRRQIDTFSAKTGVHVVHLEAPPFVATASVPTIPAVHDLRHFYPSSRSLFTGEALYQILFLRSHLRKFQAIFALSPWGSDEMQRILGINPSKIYVVPPIVGAPLLDTAENFIPRGEARYAFALGHIERRKNLGVIISASAQDAWPEDVELIIAGTDQGALEYLVELNCFLGGRARFVGPISDAEKWSLLRGATVVLLPSTVEGFGILGTEAPAVRTPVLVAKGSSLVSLGGHPRALLDGENPAEWATRVHEVASDVNLSTSIVEAQQSNLKNFSQTRVLELLLDSYRALVGLRLPAERD